MDETNQTSAAARANTQGKSKGEKKQARPKREPIGNLAELLRMVYGDKKRVVLSKADFLQIRKAARLETNERESLLQLASSDRNLDRTRELMLMGLEWDDAPHLVDQAFDFARQVLRGHSFFQSPALDAIFACDPGVTEGMRAVRALCKQTTDPAADFDHEIKKKDVERCRSNALSCLLIWFRKKNEMPMESLLQLLLEAWESPGSRNKDSAKKLKSLLGARDPGAIVAACSILDEKVNEMGRRAESALLAKEKLEANASKLGETLATTKNDLDSANARISELEKELSEVHRAHSDTVAHMRDDYEELRGRVLNRLREELALLEEGLEALRRDPPKIHVMSDHADRAIEGLRREMNRLRGNE